MSSKQTQQNKRQNYLVPIKFQLMNTKKSKTYLVNTNWTIEEFIRFMKYQLFLDADYYGVDLEKQQTIDFVPCFSKSYFDLTSFYLNDYKKYDDPLHLCTFKTPLSGAVMNGEGVTDCAFEMRNGVKPSPELFKDYFDYHYPSSFTICTKVSNPYYPYYYYAN